VRSSMSSKILNEEEMMKVASEGAMLAKKILSLFMKV